MIATSGRPLLAAMFLLGLLSFVSVAAHAADAPTASDKNAKNAKAMGTVISSEGSERATSGTDTKIVTFGDKTHVVWQDVTADGYFNKVRTLDHGTGQWTETFTLGKAKDNHARPGMTVDREGYLHVVLSGHGSPVTYRRSVRPNDATEWTAADPAGSGTYPVLTCDANGTLYMTLRCAAQWNGLDFYVKPPGKPWSQPKKLIFRDPKLPGYAGFQAGMAWSPDRETLHLVADFYESVAIYEQRGVHQAVCYMRSRDRGATWEKADGTPIKLPARPEQMDTLARKTGVPHEQISPPVLLAQGCVAVDPSGRPHILYISHLDAPGRIMHAVTDDGGHWQQTSIDAVERTYENMRPTSCRAALTISDDGTIRALLELLPLSGWTEGKPTRDMRFGEKEKRLVWLISRDGGRTFEASLALPAGVMFNEANLERPAGFSHIPAGRQPAFIYFDGTSRYPEKGEVLQNRVYFVQ